MAWLQLKAHIDPSLAEQLETLLLDEGACAITLEDGEDNPVFEPERGTTPLWAETVLTGLYDDLEGIDDMLARVQRQWAIETPDTPCPDISYDILQDQDWTRSWMDDFAPIRMGERLWIVPSWHQPPEPDAVNLALDPGLAFGTGTHPTTALCLEWLDHLAVNDVIQGRDLMDIGCGSGILAIAGLKLGAAHACGTDIDPQALQASRDNAERNQIDADDFELYYPEAAPQRTYDIVVANILAGPLVELAPMIAGHVTPGGYCALSGILAHQANDVLDAYAAQGLIMDPVTEREGWVRLTGKRPL